MSDEWVKGKVTESGNYPKNSFVGILKAAYPTFNEKLNGYVLQLDFESGQTYSMPLNAKEYGLHEDGTVDGFLSIGQFLNSLEKIDVMTGEPNMNNNDPAIKRIDWFFAFMDGTPAGFKTVPDTVGCTLHNVATKRQIGDDQQTSKYPDWTIGKIEGLLAAQAPKSTPTLKPAAPKAKPAPKPAPSTELHLPLDGTIDTDIYDVILGNPLPISGIYKQFGGKAKSPYQPGDLRVSLDRMKTQGKVIQTGDNFEGV